jgi:hypothetical protein
MDWNREIAVGFGSAYVTCDGETVWSESPEQEHNLWTFASAEQLAQLFPDSDWRIHLIAPLYEEHWKRIGFKNWELYDRGEGFA